MGTNSTEFFGHKKWAIFKNKSKCLDKKYKSKCSAVDADWEGDQEIEEKGGYWGKEERWGAKTAGRREEATKVSADELGGDGNSTQVPSTTVSSLGCSVSLRNARLLSWFTFHWVPAGQLKEPLKTKSDPVSPLPPTTSTSQKAKHKSSCFPWLPCLSEFILWYPISPSLTDPLWSSSARTW